VVPGEEEVYEGRTQRTEEIGQKTCLAGVCSSFLFFGGVIIVGVVVISIIDNIKKISITTPVFIAGNQKRIVEDPLIGSLDE